MGCRILVVDDHRETRNELRTMLARTGSLEVCGEAENGRQAVEQVRSLRPDLVVLDLAMPEMNGVEAAHEIRRIAPETKIVLFSIHDVPKSSVTVRLLEADAFVPKSDAMRLRQEIHRLLQPPPSDPS